MDNIFSDMAQMMDALTEPFGDYAPRRRHLLADYKDKEGQDYHQELMTWHNATDKALVESVKAEVARMGFTLSALLEYQDGQVRHEPSDTYWQYNYPHLFHMDIQRLQHPRSL